MSRVIPLTKGFFATVDDEDFEWLSAWKWSVICGDRGSGPYAAMYAKSSSAIRMHRLITGAAAGQFVDHINGDPLDNRRANLRLCTMSENNRNKRRSRNKFGEYKGVFWMTKRQTWKAMICVDRRRIHLGSSKDPVAMAHLYDRAAREHFGEFACVNFPDLHELPSAMVSRS